MDEKELVGRPMPRGVKQSRRCEASRDGECKQSVQTK